MSTKSLERILRSYQRCKEITRLGQGKGLRRLAAGAMASLAGWRLFLTYKLFRPSLPDALDGKGDVVVSLTSFPPRMKNLWMVIDMLMRQDPRPASIILTLCEGQFPGRRLPESLSPYLQRGLDIVWVQEDLKPHKKYHYVFQQEQTGMRRLVVTVDDDVFYAPDTIQSLLQLHFRYPDAVCANICRRITSLPDGKDAPYSEWPLVTGASGPSPDLLAIGGGGVLYPSSVYSRERFSDKDAVLSYALMADDLWLRHCERKEGIGVVTGPFRAVPPSIPSSGRHSLSSENVAHGRNDVIWTQLNGMS